jgi:hypothetical protein
MFLPEEIAAGLDELFPTGGKDEDIAAIKGRCDVLAVEINESWDSLPPELQRRILDIELEVCNRQPFSLHIARWLTDAAAIEIFEE